jgi:acetyl-CoA C-acetyltransferase
MADSVVIVSGARTPMGAFQGDFSTLAARRAVALPEAVQQAAGALVGAMELPWERAHGGGRR